MKTYGGTPGVTDTVELLTAFGTSCDQGNTVVNGTIGTVGDNTLGVELERRGGCLDGGMGMGGMSEGEVKMVNDEAREQSIVALGDHMRARNLADL